MEKSKRPVWDEYFFNMLDGISSRSTCIRRQIGAVIVKDNNIVTTGYNGQPPGMIHCSDTGECLREKLKIPSGQRAEICKAVHAEENAFLQAARHGKSVDGGTLYVMCSPCSYCTKSLLTVGIKRVVYKGIYPDDLAEELRKEATWVKWDVYKSPVVEKPIELYLGEVLKPIVEYPGYFISNYGRIFKDCIIGKNFTIEKLAKIIKKEFDSKGNRFFVSLKRDRMEYRECVARLVASAWIPNPDHLLNIRWKDKNAANNHVDNLEWVK